MYTTSPLFRVVPSPLKTRAKVCSPTAKVTLPPFNPKSSVPSPSFQTNLPTAPAADDVV